MEKNNDIHLSVVIPVYKAEECLQELYSRLTRSLETITSHFEILLIEDKGGDKSWDIITQLAKRDPRVKGLQFSRNFGQHTGITAGLDFCKGDWVVVMDCDLQDRPEEIPRLYHKAQEGYDVVLAQRGKRCDPWFKRFCSKWYYKIFSYLTEIEYDGNAGNFRIISKRVVLNYRGMREQIRFFGGLISWMGFPTAKIEVAHAERFAGKSSYSFVKLLRLASNIIIAHSDKPLRLFVGFGFFVSFISFLYGVYIICRSLVYGIPILGWSSLIVSIYLLGGIIIAILGIIGMYLGKTFNETKKRPLYIVGRMTEEA